MKQLAQSCSEALRFLEYLFEKKRSEQLYTAVDEENQPKEMVSVIIDMAVYERGAKNDRGHRTGREDHRPEGCRGG